MYSFIIPLKHHWLEAIEFSSEPFVLPFSVQHQKARRRTNARRVCRKSVQDNAK